MFFFSHARLLYRARLVSDLQKEKGFKGVIAATRKTTPGKKID
jgi:nicotinate-nucleotide pyrophosphorylase (carboxylating)